MSDPCPVMIRDIAYPSQSAAARALGVTQQTVFAAIERGDTDWVGLGRRKKPATYNGVHYESITAAAAANGMNVWKFRRLTNEHD